MHTLHSVREDAFNYVWDNALEPALEVEDGAVVELHVRDASDEQIRADSGPEDVMRLDFDHVNPASGPVFVEGASPGDVLAVELLEFRPPEWGWTALIPGFGLLADEFPEPWLRISRVDGTAGRVMWSDEISLPYRPFPGTIGVAPAEPGQHPILPPSRWGGNLDTKHLVAGSTLYLPVGVEGGSSRSATRTLRRGTARSAGRRSRPRWTSSCGSRYAGTFGSTRRSTGCPKARSPRASSRPITSAPAWVPT
jgi:acetamidase/formamidase